MTSAQKVATLQRIAALQGDADAVSRVIREVATSGVSSASISAGGGSKSYTRLDLGTLNSELNRLRSEISQLRAMLGGRSPLSIGQVYWGRS